MNTLTYITYIAFYAAMFQVPVAKYPFFIPNTDPIFPKNRIPAVKMDSNVYSNRVVIATGWSIPKTSSRSKSISDII